MHWIPPAQSGGSDGAEWLACTEHVEGFGNLGPRHSSRKGDVRSPHRIPIGGDSAMNFGDQRSELVIRLDQMSDGHPRPVAKEHQTANGQLCRQRELVSSQVHALVRYVLGRHHRDVRGVGHPLVISLRGQASGLKRRPLVPNGTVADLVKAEFEGVVRHNAILERANHKQARPQPRTDSQVFVVTACARA
ncbi:hypothetical protein L0A91_15570 [Ornithinimicrobium sp. INDO-MA30-4]|nr:hypothetical protein [Ornithinimicrobium sp. INDO-MA30-4]UJH70487.1 hypothetical protein L0A91_15570 [Ornithinimicrobium sp. INDO-MA30-4]